MAADSATSSSLRSALVKYGLRLPFFLLLAKSMAAGGEACCLGTAGARAASVESSPARMVLDGRPAAMGSMADAARALQIHKGTR